MAQTPDTFVVTAPQNIAVSIDDVLVTPTSGTQGRLADKLASAGGIGTLTAGSNITITNATGPNATVAVGTIAASSLFGNAAASAGTLAAVAIGSNLTLSVGGTLSASTPGSGTVTNVVAQGGPFLANGTISASGTISNSTASLTPHGVLLGEGTSAAVATAAGTDGQLLIATSSADPAFTTVSGDATITKTGAITVTKIGGVTPATVGNTGAVINSGTVQINASTTLTGTASGTVTIAPTTGTSDVLLNLAAAGGAQTIAAAPSFVDQRCLLSIKQGATASTVSLNTGFVFGTSGGPTSFTVTATAAVRDTLMLWTPDATHWVVMAVNQGITI